MPAVLVLVAVVIGAVLVTRVSAVVMRRAVRRFAEPSAGDTNGRWWRTGASRTGLESADATEQRRRKAM